MPVIYIQIDPETGHVVCAATAKSINPKAIRDGIVTPYEPAVGRCQTCKHWHRVDCALQYGPRGMGADDYCSKHNAKRGENG